MRLPLVLSAIGATFGGNVGRTVVSVVPIEKRCPATRGSGWEMLAEDELCVYRQAVPQEVFCLNGGKLAEDATECLVEESFPPERVCPAGSVFKGGSGCEYVRSQPATLVCENEDPLVNGECVRVESFPTRPVCPKGYNLQGDRCETSTYTSPDYHCPPEFVRKPSSTPEDGAFVCERATIASAMLNCPPGSYLHEQSCVSATSEATPVRRCASGGEIDSNGRCVSVASIEPDIVCPEHYVFTSSGRCEKPRFSNPRLRCPKDYVLQGEHCVQTIPAERYCASTEEALTANGMCVGVEQTEPLRQCPQRSVPTHGSDVSRCVVQVVYENDIELKCGDPSYALIEGRCLKKVRERDALACQEGATLTSNGSCEYREVTPARSDCPGGSVFDMEHQACATLTSTDVLVQCPRGSDYNAEDHECQTKRKYEATQICPEGLVLKRGGRIGVSECVQHKIVAPQQSCGGQGSLDSNGLTCTKQSILPALRRCPTGFSEELQADAHSVCTKTETLAITKSCPDNYRQVGNACVGKIPASPTAQDDLALEDRERLQDALEGMSVPSGKKGAALRRITNETPLLRATNAQQSRSAKRTST